MSLTLSVNVTEFNLKITDIVWLNNNGTAVRHTSGVYTITNSSLDAPVGTASLFVESVTSPAVYAGIYQVTVTNPAGSDTSTFNVSITSKSKKVTAVSMIHYGNLKLNNCYGELKYYGLDKFVLLFKSLEYLRNTTMSC